MFDLPVSSEISVKGGKGIWGMPKHQANLDFSLRTTDVSSQYDLDGRLAMRIKIDRPKRTPMAADAHRCGELLPFRGMLMKSYIYFRGKAGFTFLKKGSACLMWGTIRVSRPLNGSERGPTRYPPPASRSEAVLDDYFENCSSPWSACPRTCRKGSRASSYWDSTSSGCFFPPRAWPRRGAGTMTIETTKKWYVVSCSCSLRGSVNFGTGCSTRSSSSRDAAHDVDNYYLHFILQIEPPPASSPSS